MTYGANRIAIPSLLRKESVLLGVASSRALT
jgi:hypothetical protein